MSERVTKRTVSDFQLGLRQCFVDIRIQLSATNVALLALLLHRQKSGARMTTVPASQAMPNEAVSDHITES